ncbi:MAG: HlyD family efflux transporter periplasmic adaptor subunit [Bacteroidales bacterium]|nr:HlyD family efflux transporter periplasmic adaptor subunit [Bacteroidales bacterium]
MKTSTTSKAKRRISIILGIIVFAGAMGVTMLLAGMKEAPERNTIHDTKIVVPVTEVENIMTRIEIPVIGRLESKQTLELFSEVSGIMETGSKDFLNGVSYNKGETLLKINKDETYLSLLSKRSNLLNLISQILTDLKFDFPESHQNWESYLKEFDINSQTLALPKPVNDQEKYFIAGRNIYQTYYDIKSLETRLAKYEIKAPFSGVISQSTIKPGTLVRNGQKLGEFINPELFDLEAEVLLSNLSFIGIGDQVDLSSDDYPGSWKGYVSRISESLDSKTQTVKIYITVQADNLKNGMFLKGNIKTATLENACELPRKLLIEDKKVFTVIGDIIQSTEVEVVQIKENTAIVKGLKDGEKISQKTKGITEGMQIKVVH